MHEWRMPGCYTSVVVTVPRGQSQHKMCSNLPFSTVTQTHASDLSVVFGRTRSNIFFIKEHATELKKISSGSRT